MYRSMMVAVALACLAMAAPRPALAQKSNLSSTQKAKLAARKAALARYQSQQRAAYQAQAAAQQRAYQAYQVQALKQAEFNMKVQRTNAISRIADAAVTEAAVAKQELKLDQLKAGVPFYPTDSGMQAYPFSPGGGPPIP